MNAGAIHESEGMSIRARSDCLGLGASARQSAERSGWTSKESAELAIVVVELTTNALRHAGAGVCRLQVDPEEAVIVVEDKGLGFPSWVLERLRASQQVEGGRPHRPGGLGAGLDACSRLCDDLKLMNLTPQGARAIATRKRRA